MSVAASPLAAWVRATMAYSKVLERVAPLENELSGLVASLKVRGAGSGLGGSVQRWMVCEQQGRVGLSGGLAEGARGRTWVNCFVRLWYV